MERWSRKQWVLSLAAGPGGPRGRTAVPCRRPVRMDRRGKEQTPSGSPGVGTMSPRVPQTPDWKVVPGHAAAIPAVPPPRVVLRQEKAGTVSRQMVLKARGPGAMWRSGPSMRSRKKRSMPARSTRPTDKFDDDDYPAYTMGRAAEMIGATPAFLRALGEHRLITPLRSEGGHRRYSRYQLRIAGRARELVDSGTPIEAACRIIILEDQLEEAQRLNEELRSHGRPAPSA